MFVARDTTNEAVDKNLPQGTIINERAEGEVHAHSYEMQRPNAVAWTLDVTSSPQQQQRQQQMHPPMANYSPMGSNFPNVNPAMNATGVGQNNMAIPPGHVQVLNILDQPQSSSALEQMTIADASFLEGMPATIFDWGKRCAHSHIRP